MKQVDYEDEFGEVSEVRGTSRDPIANIAGTGG
jgi:hypothetical protein